MKLRYFHLASSRKSIYLSFCISLFNVLISPEPADFEGGILPVGSLRYLLTRPHRCLPAMLLGDLSARNGECPDSQEPPEQGTASVMGSPYPARQKSFLPCTRVGQMSCLACAAREQGGRLPEVRLPTADVKRARPCPEQET